MRNREKLSLEEKMKRAMQSAETLDEAPATTPVQYPVDKKEEQEKTIKEQERVSQEHISLSKENQVDEVIQEPKEENTLQEEQKETHNETVLNTKEISKVIKIYEKYNTFDERVQRTVLKHLNLELENKVEDVIFALLNYNKEDTMELFVELRLQDGVTRAFNLFALQEETLASINAIVESFSPYKQTVSLANKVEYCRVLERGIAEIPEKAIDHFRPLGELINIAKG